MAFRLRPDESVAHGLRRLATKELRSVRDELRRSDAPADDAIHEARKSVKKVRVIMELIDADHGHGLAAGPKRLRKVNRTLSELRDADAMLEILAKLRKKHPRLLDEHAVARVRRWLSSHKLASMKAARDDGAWKKIDRELGKLRQGVKRWRPAHRRFRALATGIRLTYRLGRKAMIRARRRRRPSDFHDWRKRVKELWYQLRLVEGSDPGIRRDVGVLQHVERWLGDDHNLVVLCAQLSKDASLCDLERVRHAADHYQRELRRKAIASCTRVYADSPDGYLRRVKHAWKANTVPVKRTLGVTAREKQKPYGDSARSAGAYADRAAGGSR